MWTDWTICNVTCGVGIKIRSRECSLPKYGGKNCKGPGIDQKICNNFSCPVDGQWTIWSKWGSCNTTCGNGLQQRFRNCSTPKFGGRPCNGSGIEAKDCFLGPCIVEGKWGDWSGWSLCSVTCGGGVRSRSRKCVGEKAALPVVCDGKDRITKICHDRISCDELQPTCTEYKDLGLEDSVAVQIRPLISPYTEFWVKCNLEDMNGIGITEIPHNQMNETIVQGQENPGQYVAVLKYNTSSVDYTRNNDHKFYWFGDGSKEVGCKCMENKSCGDKTNPEHLQLKCNCDANDVVYREDSGFIEQKDDLPITRFRAGDTGIQKADVSNSRTRSCVKFQNNQSISLCLIPDKRIEKRTCFLRNCPSFSSWTEWTTCSSKLYCGYGFQVSERFCGGISDFKEVYDNPGCFGLKQRTKRCEQGDCKAPVKLVSSEFGSGIIELYNTFTKQWLDICYKEFDLKEASLLCKYMGYNESEKVSILDVKTENGLKNIFCTGKERFLPKCTHSDWSKKVACSSLAKIQCVVDGGWSNWQPWQDCSVTCANGTRKRYRACSYPKPKNNGKTCAGPKEETIFCEKAACPIDGTWQTWSSWSVCDQSCASGKSSRTRICRKPMNGGVICNGSSKETKQCNIHPCPVNGYFKDWSNWSNCTRTCNGGSQKRTRECVPPKHKGEKCIGDDTAIRNCSYNPCPVDGYFNTWSIWSTCNLSCGGGERKRGRTCVQPLHGGKNCTGLSEEYQICNDKNCPVEGEWKPWSSWTTCSVSCSNGTQIRKRICLYGKFGGNNCTGTDKEERTCHLRHCPVDGFWEKWSMWTICSQSCGNGSTRRYRVCHEPLFGGINCSGTNMETEMCFLRECPVNGVWSEWNFWSTCNVTCGNGVRERSRYCKKPKYGGFNCSGDSWTFENCNNFPCPVNGTFSEWARWSLCNVSCGGGSRTRERICLKPKHGGMNCTGEKIEIESCNFAKCSIDGTLTEWSNWSSCSKTCGTGTSKRLRQCIGPFFGGKNCSEKLTDTLVCEIAKCPINGVFGQWSTWGDCTTTCNFGYKYRNRKCHGPFYNGKNCTGLWNEKEKCFLRHCPINGVFENWTNWTLCSSSCGSGIRVRERKCIGPLHGGSFCTGELFEKEICNTEPCPVDCEWKEWSAWSSCDISCGKGTQKRKRETIKEKFGVPGLWMNWGSWSRCSEPCGTGVSYRQRNCNKTSFGSLTDECVGISKANKSCHNFGCKPYPISCAAWIERGLTDSYEVYIDIDGDANIVFDLDHDHENLTKVEGFEGEGEFEATITYLDKAGRVISSSYLNRLIDSSSHCRQFIQWKCRSAGIHHPFHKNRTITYWKGRENKKHLYFGGASYKSQNCACGEDKSCLNGTNKELRCNCDANDWKWREDSGYLSYKDHLPVTSFQAGDTGTKIFLQKCVV
ncbi:DgyrCDS1067 [Dimorphilus gyrociliatus]|uniref:DgyrCDS1067 n=1 Tax=Dimorphilus gyrociliatus TaxID=2664684 RepID=A0A7I8V660_9ANNE|nr:DgyrCDS1067 [Dimorphilus gyrociliatus]